MVCLVLCGSIALATTVMPPTFDELVEESEVIFEGIVIAMESKWLGRGDERRIETFYTFQVEDRLTGDLAATLKLQVLGGTVGNETLEVVGAPTFSLGERTLLFVTGNGVQMVPLVRMMHGCYRIQQDPVSKTSTVAKHDGEPVMSKDDIGKSARQGAGRLANPRGQQLSGMTVQAFKEQIRDKLAQSKRR